MSQTVRTMSKRFIRRREVERRTAQSRSTIYEGMADGTFPKCVPIGKRAVGWVEDEIDGWIESRIAARDHHQVAA